MSDLSNPSYYINRELSTIEFNRRVLMESLEALCGPPGPSRDVLDGLIAAAAASGDPPRQAAQTARRFGVAGR